MMGIGVTEHVSLSVFLAPLSAAIKSVAVSTWVAAEISEISDSHHVYVTLVETGADGKPAAKLKVSIWANAKPKLFARFEQGSGEKLRKGLKVLFKLRPELHPAYGMGATVEDIDPSYTLGDAARKLLELRKRLQDEGAYDRQRLLPQPTDFTSVAVISPAGAAGEGDFRSHADPLEAAGLCRFAYFTATFQGERASPEIVSALRAVYSAHRAEAFDAVIILRGGGAQSDLAWLNDYEISNAISKMPLPVLVAIGHERDTTILDEIANVSFHTPSKAIAFVTSCIFDNAEAARQAFETIVSTATKAIAINEQRIDASKATIRAGSVSQVRVANDAIATAKGSILSEARREVEVIASGLDSYISTLEHSAREGVRKVLERIDSAVEGVDIGTKRSVVMVVNVLSRAKTVIHGATTRAIAIADREITGWRQLIRDRSFLGHGTMTKAIETTSNAVFAKGESHHARIEAEVEGCRNLIRDRSRLGVTTIDSRTREVGRFVRSTAAKDMSIIDAEVTGCRNLIRDRSFLGTISIDDRTQEMVRFVRNSAAKDISLIDAEVSGCRNLIRDRSQLGYQAMDARVNDLGGRVYRHVKNELAVATNLIDGNRGLIRDRSTLAVRNIGDRLKASVEFVLSHGAESTLRRGFVIARHRDGRPITRKTQLDAGERIQLQFADGQVGAVTENAVEI